MTRNVYVKVAGFLRWHQVFLGRLLFLVIFGGFLALWFLPSQKSFDFLGNVWFTACGVLGALWMATAYFNPDRDPNNKTWKESWVVVVINLMLLVAVSPWFR